MKLLWLNIAVVIASASCQPSIGRFCHSSYRLLKEPMAWHEASQACRGMGGALAVPNSPAEHRFLWEMLTGSTKEGNLWVGCTGTVQKGIFEQSGEDGHKCNYLNWAPGEPSGNAETVCVHMWRERDGLFDDTLCSPGPKQSTFYAICETPATTPLTLCLGSDADGRFKSPCLTGHVIHEFPTQGAMACGSACCEHPECRSFNLQLGGRLDEKICQLNNITRGEAIAGDTIADNTCTYFNV